MALPCIVCHRHLDDAILNSETNQPYPGLEFFTYGHYGSTYFDPMDGSKLILNICDLCVESLEDSGYIVRLNK